MLCDRGRWRSVDSGTALPTRALRFRLGHCASDSGTALRAVSRSAGKPRLTGTELRLKGIELRLKGTKLRLKGTFR